jgi:SAM-dependent MidA family methyltransferase
MSNRPRSPLADLIRDRIQTAPAQRITFAEFMDLALYHPDYGYYITQAAQMGYRGDFVTAVHLGADFGELLAEQLLQCWHRLGCPQPFTLLEMGAGQGVLAQQILAHLEFTAPDCFQAARYWIVERSPTLQALQQQQLAKYPVQWLTWEDIPSNTIMGCCFSNELVDAFPVHRIEVQDQQLQEIYVTVSSDSPTVFSDVVSDPSTPRLATYFKDLQLDWDAYPSGYRSEVNLAAIEWLQTVSDRLLNGYLITIDYGYPAHRYYSPARRDGTLQCYWQHAHHSDPYYQVGHQDITAHVNFTALEHYGTEVGLQTLGFIEQGLFLMALGLGDRIAALSDDAGIHTPLDLESRLKRRQRLHTLIDPYGMGNFGVLVQCKGFKTSQELPLKGLAVPRRMS